MDSKYLDADKVLAGLGSCAPYQMFATLLLSSAWVFMAFQAMSWAFIGLYHPFACVDTAYVNSSSFDISTIVYNMNCTSPMGYTCLEEADATVVFDPEFGTTVQSEYNLVCSSYKYAQLGTTLYTAGGLLTNVLITQLSDLYGRKWVFMISMWISVVLTLMRVVLPNYWSEMVVYVLLGAMTTGVTSVSWVMSCEMVSPRMRGFIVPMFCNIIWVIGYMLQGMAVYYERDWRRMILITNAPFVLSIAFIWLIPESLHWLVAEKYYERASVWVNRMCRANCKQLRPEQCLKDVIDVEDLTPERPRRTFIDVLKHPVLMFHGLICCYNGVVGMLVYWGLSLFSTQMSDNRFLGYFLSGLIEIPAGIMGPLLLLVIGRKTLTIVSFVIMAVGFIVRLLLPLDAPAWMPLTAYLFAKYGNILFFPGNFMLQSEIFPTTVRNIGFGLLGMLSTVGNMTAPFVGALLTTDPPVGCILFTGLCVIGGVISLALPETMNTSLPEDIDDVRLGPFLSKFMRDPKAERKASLLMEQSQEQPYHDEHRYPYPKNV